MLNLNLAGRLTKALWALELRRNSGNTAYDVEAEAITHDLRALVEELRDPAWVCLEGMTAGELAAYDYGCDSCMAAVQCILDGKDTGAGHNYEPWGTIRRRLLALMGDRP